MSEMGVAMKIKTTELPHEIRQFLEPLFGKRCCRQRVSAPKALHLGFGERMYHGNPKLVDAYYGEWEIGTYYCAWRVIKDAKILCGSDDAVESVDELDASLKQIELGAVLSIEQLGNLDVRVELDTGAAIEFLATTSDEADECFGINNGVSHQLVEFTVGSGWTMGASNLPWRR
jgi:hypothetical protein